MFQPAKWTWGLPVLGVVWIAANWSATSRIEADLAARARAALPQGSLDQAAVALAGRDATLTGTAFDPAGRDASIAAVAALPGIRLVNADVAALPLAKPYGVAATLAARKLVLTGTVLNPQARAKLLAAAKAAQPGAEIADQMTYASGQPQNFDALAAAAIAGVADLSKGASALADGKWNFAGEAASSAAFEHALQAIAKPPGGLAPGAAAVTPPEARPYVWSAALDGKALTLSGFVPSPEARAALNAKAAVDFPGIAVVDNQKYARGAATDALEGLEAAGLDQLARLSSGQLDISDTHVAAGGMAKNGAQVGAIGAALTAALPKGFDLASNAIVAPPARPFVFNAERTAEGLRLTGFAPDDAARAKVLAEAKALLPQAQVTDELGIASGLPAALDFAAAASFALKQAAGLAQGRAGFSDGAIGVSGEAAQTAAASAIAAAMQTGLPKGFVATQATVRDLQAEAEAKEAAARQAAEQKLALKEAAAKEAADKELVLKEAAAKEAAAKEAAAKELAQNEAAAKEAAAKELALKETPVPEAAADAPPQAAAPALSPTGFAAQKTGDSLILTGVFHDAAEHKQLLALAARAFFGVQIVDRTRQSDKAPATLQQAAEHGLQQLARLDSGMLTLDGGKLKLEGAARFDEAAGEIKDALAAEPVEGYAVETSLSTAQAQPAADPAACKTLIAALSQKGAILFDTAKATIHRDSAGFLDFIAATALRCRDARIEIGGHTDSDGGEAANLDLSQRRAEAVAARLAKAGLAAANITAKGYGESRPVASNDTPEGKARNRRIEFAVTD